MLLFNTSSALLRGSLINFLNFVPIAIWLLLFQGALSVFVAILFFTTSEQYKRSDKILGDMSYYIYLLHWQIGLILTCFLGFTKGNYLVVASIPLALIVSYVLVIKFGPVVLKIKQRL